MNNPTSTRTDLRMYGRKYSALYLLLCTLNLNFIKCESSNQAIAAESEPVKQTTREAETPDGCPFRYDFGRLAYKYKRPNICDTLLPNGFQSQASQQRAKVPFEIDMRLAENSDDAYNHIVISVGKGFNYTIAGAVLKVEKIKPNGKLSRELHAGHLEGPGVDGFCCAESKFNNLVVFVKNVTEPPVTQMKIRWYPFNFGVGRITLTANIFADNETYWRISNLEYKIPIVAVSVSTASPVQS